MWATSVGPIYVASPIEGARHGEQPTSPGKHAPRLLRGPGGFGCTIESAGRRDTASD